MQRLFVPHVQRLVLRLVFAGGVVAWSFLERHPAAAAVRILTAVFAVCSVLICRWEQRSVHRITEARYVLLADVLFIGPLVLVTGGAQSSFYLLLYFIITLHAPFVSWVQALVVSAACTLVYMISICSTLSSVSWFDVAIRIGFFWFLSIILRIIGLKSIGERERAERLARELSATHDEIRRYTAALEKTNMEKENRLAEVTLLHYFAIKIRGLDDYKKGYEAVFSFAGRACEARWIFLHHRRDPGRSRVVFRSWGYPPEGMIDRFREMGLGADCGEDGYRTLEVFDGFGRTAVRTFRRCRENESSIVLRLVFPKGHADMGEDQIKVLSALMDTTEMEMELIRLQNSLRSANLKLSESNRHLLRLHELQNELSRGFLAREDVSDVVHGIHEIMAKELFELDRLNLFLPNEETGMLECRTSVGIKDYPQEKIRVPMDEQGGAISKAYREGVTIFFDGKSRVPDDLRLSDPYNRIPAVRSRIFVIVPLLDHKGRSLGVIGADRKHSHRPIPKETVTMLEFFARHVAMVLALQHLR